MPLSSKAWQLNKINMIFFFPPWKELQQKCKFSGFCWERNYWGKFSSFSLFYIWSKAAECGNKTGLAVLMQLLQKFSTVSWMCDDTWKYGQNPTLAKEKNPQNPAITDFSPQNTLFFLLSVLVIQWAVATWERFEGMWEFCAKSSFKIRWKRTPIIGELWLFLSKNKQQR